MRSEESSFQTNVRGNVCDKLTLGWMELSTLLLPSLFLEVELFLFAPLSFEEKLPLSLSLFLSHLRKLRVRKRVFLLV